MALAVLGLLAGVKAVGWILLATALAQGIAQLASALPAPESSNLIGLLFRPDPASYDPAVHGLTAAGTPAFAGTVALGLAGVLARALATWGQQVFSRRAALGAKEELRHGLVRHRLAAAGAEADRAGQDSVLAATGLDGLDKYFTQYLPALLTAAVMPLVLGVWILTHDWVSALVLVLTIPLIPLFMVLIGRYTEDRVQQAADGLDRLSHHLLELARGLPVLVGLRRAGTQRQALAGVSERYRSTTMATLKTAFMSGFALELISTLSVAIVAVFIGVRLVYGQLDLYTGLLILTLAPEVYLPFRDIGSAHHASEDGVEALRRARAEVGRPVPSTLADREHADGPGRGQDVDRDVIRVRQLSIAYRDPDGGAFPDVVRNLDLDLVPGRLTVLGGPSGTGKTTTLSALAGVLREGEARFSGATGGLAGRPVAWLGQHPQFSEPTVGGELELYAAAAVPADRSAHPDHPATAVPEERLRQWAGAALAACGLAGTGERHPDELSPGERRRLGLARVLVRLVADAATRPTGADGEGPDRGPAWLVVLDEPTAHLDPANAERLRSVITALAAGRLAEAPGLRTIVLAASHDRALHALADTVVGAVDADADSGAGSDAAGPAGTEAAAMAVPADVTEDGAMTGEAAAADGSSSPDEVPASRGRWRSWLRILPLTERRFIAGVLWAAAATLAAALLSGLSGWLIVQAAYEPPVMYLLSVIVMVRFFGIGRALFRYLERLDTHDAVLGWANRVRLRLWDALGSHAGQWGRLTRSGGALSVLVADVDELRDAVPRVIVPIPAAVISWLATVVIVLAMAPAAWWPVVVAGVAGMVLVPLLVGLVDRRTTRNLTDHRTGLLRRTSALFSAAADLAGNGAAMLASSRFAAADQAADRPLRRSAAAAGLGQGLVVLISGWAAVQTLVLCFEHGVTAPATAMVVFLMLALAEPLGLFSTACQETAVLGRQLAKTAPLLAAGADDGGEVGSDAAGAPAGGGVRVRPVAGCRADDGPRVVGLELDHATVRYPGTGRDVFSGVDLRVCRGGFAVVTGPSGAGKSTLLAVLLGFLRPRAGRYLLDVADPGPSASPADRAGGEASAEPVTEPGPEAGPGPGTASALRSVAWCPQEAYLFDSTLRANLALARDPADRPDDTELERALVLVGLGDWLRAAPEGLGTRIGPSGHYLSGGQRQRVAVARALLARADVVLLDEPTAHLGADEAAELVADLKRALRDRTTVMVTHDRRFAQAGTVTLELDGRS